MQKKQKKKIKNQTSSFALTRPDKQKQKVAGSQVVSSHALCLCPYRGPVNSADASFSMVSRIIPANVVVINFP